MQAAVYKDGVDTDAGPLVISGWTTEPNHYIRVYTPVSASEVGESQRHTGVAGTGFIMRPSDATMGNREAIFIADNYVRIEGLELDGIDLLLGDSIQGIQIETTAGSTDVRIESNIIHNIINSNNTASNQSVDAIQVSSSGTTDLVKISNNIIFDIDNVNTDPGSNPDYS